MLLLNVKYIEDNISFWQSYCQTLVLLCCCYRWCCDQKKSNDLEPYSFHVSKDVNISREPFEITRKLYILYWVTALPVISHDAPNFKDMICNSLLSFSVLTMQWNCIRFWWRLMTFSSIFIVMVIPCHYLFAVAAKFLFGWPFVKRFTLCYRTIILSVLSCL